MHGPTRTLRAATHGRSAWDIHVPIADLAIALTEIPNPVGHEKNLTYTVNVTNKGPDIANSTLVSDTTPVGTTFVSSTTSTGTCTAPAIGGMGTLRCNVGNLASGAKVTITMTVKDTAGAGSTLTDTGRASSATPDPNGNNNAMTVKTSVN
jgi:large repetitive protein